MKLIKRKSTKKTLNCSNILKVKGPKKAQEIWRQKWKLYVRDVNNLTVSSLYHRSIIFYRIRLGVSLGVDKYYKSNTIPNLDGKVKLFKFRFQIPYI